MIAVLLGSILACVILWPGETIRTLFAFALLAVALLVGLALGVVLLSGLTLLAILFGV